MNMPISLQESRRLFPSEINGVKVVWNNDLKNGIEIPMGSVVIVDLGKGKLRDEFGNLIGKANFYEVTAFHNGTEYYSKSLRTTRWVSGKLRWRINQRLSTLIHKAATYVHPEG